MMPHQALLRALAAVSIFEKHQRKWQANPATVLTLFDAAGISSRDTWFHSAIAERVKEIDDSIPPSKKGADEAAEWLFGPKGIVFRNLMIEVQT
jgi:hypothetical protein